MSFMRAFEVYLDGKKLCVAGIGYGELLFSLSYFENEQGELATVNLTGMKLTQEVVRWLHLSPKIGAEVTVKIVETDQVDEPEVLQKPPRDERKYEKAAVRRMAKEFGWTIQTGKRKKSR